MLIFGLDLRGLLLLADEVEMLYELLLRVILLAITVFQVFDRAQIATLIASFAIYLVSQDCLNCARLLGAVIAIPKLTADNNVFIENLKQISIKF